MTVVSSPITSPIKSARRGPVVFPDRVFYPGIHLDFASGIHYTKVGALAPTVAPLTGLFTFTCGNQSMYRASSGLLVQAVTNTPRIEYNAGGSCLGLLMEASRTNLALQSQTLPTSWATAACSVSADAGTAPDGTTTADKIVENSAAAQHVITQIGITPLVAASVYTVSFFVKAAERFRGRLIFLDSTQTDGVSVNFNLNTATVSGAAALGAGTLTASGIEAYANGWYRVWVSGAMNNAKTTGGPYLNLQDASGNQSYLGDGASGMLAWGAQLELGAFPSTYIPTTTVSVARTACSAIRTLSTEYSATAGTVVIQGRASGGRDGSNAQTAFDLNDASALNRISLNRPSAGDVARFSAITATVEQGPLDATFVNSSNYKAAMAFALNDLAYSFNGAAVLTDTVAVLLTATRLELGSGVVGTLQANGHIRRFDYYPERKSNGFLQAAST